MCKGSVAYMTRGMKVRLVKYCSFSPLLQTGQCEKLLFRIIGSGETDTSDDSK